MSDTDRFDGPALETMRAQIHATPMRAARRGSGSPRVVRWLAGVGAAGAAAAVGLVIALGAAHTPAPAYAATLHPQTRTVTITLRELSDIGKLNARLAALGTRIRVVPVKRGCDAPVQSVSNDRLVPGGPRTLDAAYPLPTGGYFSSVTVLVSTLPGRTLVIPATPTGMLGGGGVVVGRAPACVGPAPAPTATSLLRALRSGAAKRG